MAAASGSSTPRGGSSLSDGMAHRIEVELTSKSDDGTWTWRAAGAKLPRGSVDASLVPAGATVGAVLRAEVEVTLDGTSVLALMPPKVKSTGRVAEKIEIIAAAPKGPDVNVVLASKGGRRRDRDDNDGERRPPKGGPRPAGDRAAGDRGPRGEGGRRPRTDGERSDAPRSGRTGATGGERSTGASRGPGRSGGDRPGRDGGGRDSARRPATSTVYRNAALAELAPEQLPVAEQLIKGGIPSVRQALEEQNARARAEHRPEVTPGPLLALAEQLLPVINLATWKDRASVAKNAGKDIPLRELRSIVAATSTVTLDAEAQEMATALRTSLNERVTALRDRWVERITNGLDNGNVLDAVRTANRPPEPSARLSAELAVRLADAAGAAMNADTPAEAWKELLGAVVDCPVRRTVKPQGLPTGADEELLAAARQASGYVPELARLMGIPIPPPPGPRRPVPARAGQRRRPS